MGCPVCMESLFDGKVLTATKCGHFYHRDCLVKMIQSGYFFSYLTWNIQFTFILSALAIHIVQYAEHVYRFDSFLPAEGDSNAGAANVQHENDKGEGTKKTNAQIERGCKSDLFLSSRFTFIEKQKNSNLIC